MRTACALLASVLVLSALGGCLDESKVEGSAADDSPPLPAGPAILDVALSGCSGIQVFGRSDPEAARSVLPPGYAPRDEVLVLTTLTLASCDGATLTRTNATAEGDAPSEGRSGRPAAAAAESLRQDLGPVDIAWSNIALSEANGTSVADMGFLAELFVASPALVEALRGEGWSVLEGQVARSDPPLSDFEVAADGIAYSGQFIDAASAFFSYDATFVQPGGPGQPLRVLQVHDSSFTGSNGAGTFEASGGVFATLKPAPTTPHQLAGFTGSVELTFSQPGSL